MASSVLDATGIDDESDHASEIDLRFALGNDVAQVPDLIAHLQTYIARFGLFDSTGSIRVGIALEEAISNAIHHGNLELSSELREDGSDRYLRLAAERRASKPYAERRVYIEVHLSRAAAVFTIKDQGPGFDPSQLADPTSAENIAKLSGRGLLLIRSFMDAVEYNKQGNELTMQKRRTVSSEDRIGYFDSRR